MIYSNRIFAQPTIEDLSKIHTIEHLKLKLLPRKSNLFYCCFMNDKGF